MSVFLQMNIVWCHRFKLSGYFNSGEGVILNFSKVMSFMGISNVNGSSSGGRVTLSDDQHVALANKMFEEFKSARQGYEKLIVAFEKTTLSSSLELPKFSKLSSSEKEKLVVDSNLILAKMADNLVLAGANKDLAINSSCESKDLIIKGIDSYVKDAKLDANTLKTLRNTYVASLRPDSRVTESAENINKSGEGAEGKSVKFSETVLVK
ncbi:hypothetical protein [Pseudomonas sp. UW4]|uniref:hypothetical protein n=1 Tax=Pseudomonas sp. UW4 TaxID=1207075 RepID=UPI00059BAB19|nr:hypothetical protein [Pseudomonas sp. UW4]